MDDYWPLFGLELRTPALVLRPVRDEDLAGLVSAIDAGVHDPDTMPFAVPWTDAEPTVRARRAVQHWWATRASWRPEEWDLDLAVHHRGRPVGVQSLRARDFAILREVSSGSWLSSPLQGRGLGKEMRAAVCTLAFDGLGAEVARSGAFADNPASAAVSRAVGYEVNGRERHAPRGAPKEMVRFELTKRRWQERRRSLPAVEIVGLDPDVLDMFGAGQPRR